MRILSLLFDFIGFGFGIPIGLVLGFFIFIYSKPEDVKVINDKIENFLNFLSHYFMTIFIFLP